MTVDTSVVPAVRCVALRKTFGGIVALNDLNLEILPGTIHALIGENGAGKSTCLGLLAGRITPSAGHVELNGERVELGNPRVARGYGVAAIYQELTIVPALSTQANIFLAHPISRLGFLLREKAMRERVNELSSRLGSIPVDVPAGDLSVADQQIVEIARGMLDDPKLMLFDEPTSSLALAERASLFRVMRELKDSGVTIVFVSHNLDEVLDIADTISVFRDGELVSTAPVDSWTKPSLVHAMLGSAKAESVLMTAMVGEETAATPATGAPSSNALELLRVEGLSIPNTISDINLVVRQGEILGLGGLVGSGRTSILRAISGLERDARGRLWVRGKEVPWPKSPRAALRLGIALIPEDRKKEGLILRRSAMENIILSSPASTSRFGIVSRRRSFQVARTASEPYRVNPDRLPRLAGELSGGNQQKLLFARWRVRRPMVLLADEPTRGVDVGAKTEILRSLVDLSKDGMGVILVSSELEEVVSVSDRVAVLSQGRFVVMLEQPHISSESILSAAFNV